jgi:hypothetical protein
VRHSEVQRRCRVLSVVPPGNGRRARPLVPLAQGMRELRLHRRRRGLHLQQGREWVHHGDLSGRLAVQGRRWAAAPSIPAPMQVIPSRPSRFSEDAAMDAAIMRGRVAGAETAPPNQALVRTAASGAHSLLGERGHGAAQGDGLFEDRSLSGAGPRRLLLEPPWIGPPSHAGLTGRRPRRPGWSRRPLRGRGGRRRRPRLGGPRCHQHFGQRCRRWRGRRQGTGGRGGSVADAGTGGSPGSTTLRLKIAPGGSYCDSGTFCGTVTHIAVKDQAGLVVSGPRPSAMCPVRRPACRSPAPRSPACPMASPSPGKR